MISVIVRSCNDRDYIGETLSMLLRQQVDDEVEILNFDSRSTDGTMDIVRSFPAVRAIPPEEGPYVPGKVLNRAVREAKGEIIVFNNSDAIPQHCDYLAKLIAPLRDPAVGAVYGNQLPRPDAWPLVRKDNLRAFGDGQVAATWEHMFSMASSAARRDVLQHVPFDESFQYSEDIEWSLRLKRQYHYRIVYVPEAEVEHSHNYPPAALRKRFYNEGRANAMMYRRRPSALRALLAFGREAGRDFNYLLRNGELKYLASGLRYRALQRLSTYRGERDWAKENLS